MTSLRPLLGTGILTAAPARLARPKAPARPGFLRRVGTAVAAWRERRVLAQLPDYILDDIGLTRADVDRELVKPAWADVDWKALEEARRRR